MVEEIRVYAEGGGDGKDTKALVRQGFHCFLNDLVLRARTLRIKWQIIACGPRAAAYSSFMTALRTHPGAFNVLLVDSEGPVSNSPKRHLEARDGWNLLTVDDEHCHLMVHMMEAWFLTDVETLKNFYGQGFNANSLPGNPAVEQIAKADLESALKAATKHTTKGEYHKIKHGPKLLKDLSVLKVRAAAPHCDRIFSVLEGKMTQTLTN